MTEAEILAEAIARRYPHLLWAEPTNGKKNAENPLDQNSNGNSMTSLNRDGVSNNISQNFGTGSFAEDIMSSDGSNGPKARSLFTAE